ncbi:protein pangolin, isoforms A/H/I/S-like isoform X2 [Watersipora subatra]|uniref:protein pangolin, isoforms A/H/I/S-like isoform X2 n=1 Tax=Watersipora subatra TaxID=2589382 RepID=UPI00355C696D
MPHVSATGPEDLASTDEVKVYNDEGEQEEQRTSEDISEVKLGLVTETEQGKTLGDEHSFNGKEDGEKNGSTSRLPPEHEANPFYFYPYTHNGASSGKLGLGSVYDTLQPPPAHAGISTLPLLSFDKSGLHRPALFSLPGASGQYPPFYPDLSVQSWPGSTYPVTSVGMRSPYTGLLAAARGYSPLMSSPLSPGMSQPSLVSQAGSKHDIHPNMLQENRFLPHPYGNGSNSHEEHHHHKEKKKPHIKKPLNAFMLFMKDMRAKVVAECTLKESAAINQILGRKWHALDRAEQAKYYDMAKKERELHLKLYPGWSARDNYAMHSKRKKRRREPCTENKECSNPKKCRARFGLDQQNQWCKPCRRKKKCIRFMTGDPNADEHTDKEDEEDDDDDMDNNNSLSARAAGSDSDDSSQTGYDSSECGGVSSSLLNPDSHMIASTSHKHSIGGILGIPCPSGLTAHTSNLSHNSQSTNRVQDSSALSSSQPAIHAT